MLNPTLFRNTLLLLFLLISASAFAQKPAPTEDVVYLKNGGVMRGVILELDMESHVKIETADRNVFVYSMEEVDTIKKEEMPAGSANRGRRNWSPQEKGFVSTIETGLMVGSSSGYASSVLGGFLVSNGYQFNSKYSAGVMTGIEGFGVATIPLMADFRYSPLQGTSSPFAYVRTGVAIPFDDGYYRYNPGVGAGVGMGIKKYIGRSTAFLFTFGYRFQRLTGETSNPWDSFISQTEDQFNRFSMRFGFQF